MFSWSENLINILSWDPALPIFVSVPRIIKCLSLSETIDITDFVGAPVKVAALVTKAEELDAIGYVNGAVYWMGQSGGFFVYDGTVKSLPCLVEDFVFDTAGTDLGLNFTSGELIYAGYNTLYSEINWFYPKAGSDAVDRIVTYNYDENTWTTGSLSRTTYYDATLFDNP